MEHIKTNNDKMKKLLQAILSARFTLLLFVMLAAVTAARQRTLTERLMDEMRNPKSKYVFVAAHRGDWRNWPENSVEAMQSAIEMGADIVEIDVPMTSDSVLIVMHDRRADRTTKAKGLVSDLKWTDLGKFRDRERAKRQRRTTSIAVAGTRQWCRHSFKKVAPPFARVTQPSSDIVRKISATVMDLCPKCPKDSSRT